MAISPKFKITNSYYYYNKVTTTKTYLLGKSTICKHYVKNALKMRSKLDAKIN